MELLVPDFGLILWLSLLIICFVLWLAALIDAVRSTFANPTEKLIWVLIILFVPIIIGPLLYYFIGRHKKLSS